MTKIGPSRLRSSSPIPSGACSAKNARCSLENSLRSGAEPSATSCTGVFGTPFSEAEQTKKCTSRTCAPSGSSPSACSADRCADSGIVSFSSTLSAPFISESISISASSVIRAWTAAGMGARSARAG
jgi:hypothetical protein